MALNKQKIVIIDDNEQFVVCRTDHYTKEKFVDLYTRDLLKEIDFLNRIKNVKFVEVLDM